MLRRNSSLMLNIKAQLQSNVNVKAQIQFNVKRQAPIPV